VIFGVWISRLLQLPSPLVSYHMLYMSLGLVLDEDEMWQSIIWPCNALCHLILDVGHDLDGAAHNIAVGYVMFLHVNRTPNWWPLWQLHFQCFWTLWVHCQAKRREIRTLGTQRYQANGNHWMDTLGTQRGESMGNMRLGKSTLPCESSPLLRIRRGCDVLLSPL